MAKNEVIYQGLSELNVVIEDISANSPDYFRVTELPTELTAGLNTFKFKGNVSLFPENSAVYIEILDANGLPVYYEVGIDLESQDQLAIVTIFINEDTTPGNGSIIICSTLNQSAEGQILDPSEINVRWQVPIYIDISKRNEDAIIFSSLPRVTLTSSTGSHKEISYYGFGLGYPGTNKSQTQQDGFTTNGSNYIKYYYNNDTPVIILPLDMSQTTYDDGAPIYGFLSHIENATISFTYSRIVNSDPTRPSNIVSQAVSASISSYSGSLIAYLSEPLSYALSNSNDRFYPKSLDLNRMNISYVMPTEPDAFGYVFSNTTQNTYNIITASFTNLSPLTGEIAKIRTYYRSSGINEYILLNETDITTYAEEFGFNTSSLQNTFSLPTSHRNEKIDFKFEFVNTAGNASKQVIEVRDNTLQGGNTYIGGDDNLMTGSLYVAGATGTGVHLSGKGNASMIRSIGYSGFKNATTTSGGSPVGYAGFVIYSGSIQPLLSSAEQYSGVGIELVANTASYFKYTTSGSGLLDIRTKNFFLGDPAASYISGSGTIFQISSSNFSISPQGNVYVKGNINATEGLFENIIISGVTPQSQISGSSVITRYLIEPWFTSSAVIDTVNSIAVGAQALSVKPQTTMSFGLSRWIGEGTDYASGKDLFTYSNPIAATYKAGSGSFDNMSYTVRSIPQDFEKLGDIKQSYEIPEYQDKITFGSNKTTVDNLIMPVGSDASVFSLTSDNFHISSSILSKANANFKPLVLQFAAKFGNLNGFKDYTSEFGGELRLWVYIYDENNNELYREFKVQSSFFEWIDVNIPLTPVLTYKELSDGSFNVYSKFKIKLEWQQRTAVSDGSEVTHIRFSELKIVQLAEAEGLKTKILQFKDSALLGGTAGTLSYGSFSPISDNLYDLGIYNESWDTSKNFKWRNIYASGITVNTITSSYQLTYAINSSTINNGYQNRNLGSYNIICGTYLSGSNSQLVVGTYNRYSTLQNSFIIGNGTSESSRRNLVFTSGSTFQVTGSLTVTGSINIKDVIVLEPRTTTPTNPATGSLIMSASGASGMSLFAFTGNGTAGGGWGRVVLSS